MIRILMMLLQATAPAAATATPPTGTTDTSMELACRGGGAARKTDTRTAFVMGSDGQSAWGTVNGRHSEGFDDQVTVRLSDASGTIRMPRTMLPPLHGGNGGWFELRRYSATPDTIDGEVAVSMIDHPKVHIDRRTGTISIDGKVGHYSGQCEKFDPASQLRRF